VIPAYLVTGITTFCAVWFGVGLPFPELGDDGSSWFSIFIVIAASFTAASVSALVAPKHKLIVALVMSSLTVCLVPHPYTFESSGDGEAIPSIYELVGAIVGGIFAVGVIFFGPERKWKGRNPEF